MQKLYENFHIFHFQKKVVSVETIRGNTVSQIKIQSTLSRAKNGQKLRFFPKSTKTEFF